MGAIHNEARQKASRHGHHDYHDKASIQSNAAVSVHGRFGSTRVVLDGRMNVHPILDRKCHGQAVARAATMVTVWAAMGTVNSCSLLNERFVVLVTDNI
jgi:hypothetical protein